MNTTAIHLCRDISAIQIPSGETIMLPAGSEVVITQSLGGAYTVACGSGLARISASDADALGIESDDKIEDSSSRGVARPNMLISIVICPVDSSTAIISPSKFSNAPSNISRQHVQSVTFRRDRANE